MSERLPDWPRRMGADLAAAYLGIGATKFLDDVKAGKYPAGIRDGARVLWDRKGLDEAVDRQAGHNDNVNPIRRAIRERKR